MPTTGLRSTGSRRVRGSWGASVQEGGVPLVGLRHRPLVVSLRVRGDGERWVQGGEVPPAAGVSAPSKTRADGVWWLGTALAPAADVLSRGARGGSDVGVSSGITSDVVLVWGGSPWLVSWHHEPSVATQRASLNGGETPSVLSSDFDQEGEAPPVISRHETLPAAMLVPRLNWCREGGAGWVSGTCSLQAIPAPWSPQAVLSALRLSKQDAISVCSGGVLKL